LPDGPSPFSAEGKQSPRKVARYQVHRPRKDPRSRASEGAL